MRQTCFSLARLSLVLVALASRGCSRTSEVELPLLMTGDAVSVSCAPGSLLRVPEKATVVDLDGLEDAGMSFRSTSSKEVLLKQRIRRLLRVAKNQRGFDNYTIAFIDREGLLHYSHQQTRRLHFDASSCSHLDAVFEAGEDLRSRHLALVCRQSSSLYVYLYDLVKETVSHLITLPLAADSRDRYSTVEMKSTASCVTSTMYSFAPMPSNLGTS